LLSISSVVFVALLQNPGNARRLLRKKSRFSSVTGNRKQRVNRCGFRPTSTAKEQDF